MTSSIFDVSDKVICVTGASSGIGQHLASFLASNGAKVIGVARRADLLQKWCSETQVNIMGDVDFVACDLSRPDQLDKIANKVKSKFGPPDILINAAGINTRDNADAINIDNWQLTINLNLTAPFFLAQNFTVDMASKGWGRIINFASLQSFRAFPDGISYGTSKGGVAQMTRAMAENWSSKGITANAIGPGFFKTELTEAVFADEKRSQRNAMQTCIGRNGELSDLEGPVQFFCSDASRYVTGQILMVDGGFTAK